MSLYKMYGYAPEVLRPQLFLEDVIETVNSQNRSYHSIWFDISFHSTIWCKRETDKVSRPSRRSALQDTFLMSSLIWYHWRKITYFGHISYSSRHGNTLRHTLQQKTSGSMLGHLLPIMPMAVAWHWLRVGPSDIYLTSRASFKDPWA